MGNAIDHFLYAAKKEILWWHQKIPFPLVFAYEVSCRVRT